MMLKEPKVEFVPIDLNAKMTTVSCPDGVTDGGTYCIDSSVTSDCGSPMAATNTEEPEE